MTHDKLLTLLKDYASKAGLRMDRNCWLILSDVVELHKPKYWQNPNVPEWNGANCTHCLEERGDYMSPIEASYPCPTIQAIEKELV